MSEEEILQQLLQIAKTKDYNKHRHMRDALARLREQEGR